ncbi:hypothetical protein GCM10022243_67750 [Saccharothrix violaceirubra]|uniref:Uncharacterized protein n=1 Tax=Saccharothrix violaceirubra TaxID=413306 RepID=A0A7W7T8E6_9PSEU|nr:AMED_5909 family protein [Saccharothrix violaceirubra]MBB4968488.1 hypothetical protein [Saccharothrix violaceirubra]
MRKSDRWTDALASPTLHEAHVRLGKLAPPPNAAPEDRIAYHERCRDVYSKVSKVDAAHKHEATAWATCELNSATRIRNALKAEQEGAGDVA